MGVGRSLSHRLYWKLFFWRIRLRSKWWWYTEGWKVLKDFRRMPNGRPKCEKVRSQ